MRLCDTMSSRGVNDARGCGPRLDDVRESATDAAQKALVHSRRLLILGAMA